MTDRYIYSLFKLRIMLFYSISLQLTKSLIYKFKKLSFYECTSLNMSYEMLSTKTCKDE